MLRSLIARRGAHPVQWLTGLTASPLHGFFREPAGALLRPCRRSGAYHCCTASSHRQENNLNYEKFLHVSEYPMPEAMTPDF